LFVNEKNVEQLKINPPQQKKFNQLYSDKKLGSFVNEGRTFFRVFSPSAEDVKLIMFENPEQVFGKAYDMQKDENGNTAIFTV
jgi:pullulanase/glycogen debranching enzyme